jgi:hypothetical protein
MGAQAVAEKSGFEFVLKGRGRKSIAALAAEDAAPQSHKLALHTALTFPCFQAHTKP